MTYKVDTINTFRKEAKRLIKKFPSLQNELRKLGQQLSTNPTFGTPLGNHCYKIRLAVASKGKGKSGGARVITYLYITNATVFLLSIYDKSERNDISDKELLQLLKELP